MPAWEFRVDTHRRVKEGEQGEVAEKRTSLTSIRWLYDWSRPPQEQLHILLRSLYPPPPQHTRAGQVDVTRLRIHSMTTNAQNWMRICLSLFRLAKSYNTTMTFKNPPHFRLATHMTLVFYAQTKRLRTEQSLRMLTCFRITDG